LRIGDSFDFGSREHGVSFSVAWILEGGIDSRCRGDIARGACSKGAGVGSLISQSSFKDLISSRLTIVLVVVASAINIRPTLRTTHSERQQSWLTYTRFQAYLLLAMEGDCLPLDVTVGENDIVVYVDVGRVCVADL
jgi:hypothetical protein